MNQKSFVCFIMLSAILAKSISATPTKNSQNLWQPRSFTGYSSREMLLQKTMYQTESSREEWNGTFSIASEYMQNFSKKCNTGLGALPFWSGTNVMTYGQNDGKSDIDSYQFGMGDVIGQGEITLNPQVAHMGGDMLLHFTHTKDNRSFYFKIRSSVGAMSIYSKLTEKIANKDVATNEDTNEIWIPYPIDKTGFSSLSEAWNSGGSSASGVIVNSTLTKPVHLRKGRISPCKLTAINVGDIKVATGYSLFANENGFFSFGVNASLPTQHSPIGKYILEPVFGRTGHWGIGCEMTGHYRAWTNDKNDMYLDIWGQGDLLHLRSGRKPDFRSFDLKQNGPGSKYMLIQMYFPTTPSSDNAQGRIPGFITNAVNATTLPVISTFKAEGTASLMLDFHKKNWNVAVGGEFWGRTKESLSIDECNLINTNAPNINDFAVLGRQISEDSRNIEAVVAADKIKELYLCEPLARINKSENRAQGTYVSPAIPAAPTGYDTTKIKDARFSENRIPADLNEALDICGAEAQSVFSAKVFTQFGYTWNDNRYTPNLSVTAGAEFTPKKDNVTVNFWSVGGQASLSF